MEIPIRITETNEFYEKQYDENGDKKVTYGYIEIDHFDLLEDPSVKSHLESKIDQMIMNYNNSSNFEYDIEPLLNDKLQQHFKDYIFRVLKQNIGET